MSPEVLRKSRKESRASSEEYLLETQPSSLVMLEHPWRQTALAGLYARCHGPTRGLCWRWSLGAVD